VEKADTLLTIRRRGKIESLNAAVAAGICIHGIVEKLNMKPTGDEGEE
jgi:tRNA G18 (ribose-2'-O)-methylase SpoU